VLVEGVNVACPAPQADQVNPQGGIDRREAPMHISKVAIADPKDGKATRVRFETKDGKKVRVAVKSGETSMADKYTPRLKSQYDERSPRR
jgi:large subunit ribosomal protein L24